MAWHEQRQNRIEKEKVSATHLNTYWNSFSFPAFKTLNANTLPKEATWDCLVSDETDDDKVLARQYT